MNITPIITNTYKLYIQTPKNPVKKENTSGGKSLLLDNPAARFLPFAGNVDLKQKPEYKTLSAEERKIVDAVIKFKTHDDSTQADIDLGNYYRQLKKVGFSTRESQRTCELIRNKDWQKKLRTNMSEKAVKEVAFLFRRPGDLKLAKIIAPKPFSSTQINSLKKVEKAIEKIYDRGIYLPQTRIPKASQLKPDGINCIEKNGIKIIRFAPDSDFEAIGFEKGTNMTKDRDNFFTLVKMRSYK